MKKKSDYLILLLFIAGGAFLYMNKKTPAPVNPAATAAACAEQPLTLSPEVKAYIDSLIKGGTKTPEHMYKMEELTLHLSNLERKIAALDSLKEGRQKNQQQITELRNKLQQQKQAKIKSREELREQEFQILRKKLIAACRADAGGGSGDGGGGRARGGRAQGGGGMRPGGMAPMSPMTPAADGETDELE